MLKKITLLACLLLSLQGYAQLLSIDESNATVSFLFVDDDVDGTLGDFNFNGNLNLDQLAGSSVGGWVATNTLDTDNWLRNRMLRGRKYFASKDHPTINFYSLSISGNKKSFTVVGNLSIKGIEQAVTFRFTNSGNRLVGKASINSQDFDISLHKDRSRNKVNITVVLPYSFN